MRKTFVIAVVLFLVLMFIQVVSAETTLDNRSLIGERKCDWSVRGFSGTIWLTIKSVENDVVKGEVRVTGSKAITYEKFKTGKIKDSIITISLQRFLFLFTIENGNIVGGESHDLLNPVYDAKFSCFRMK